MRIRAPAALPDTTIGVRAAARKYGIPPNTITQWHQRGEVRVLQRQLGADHPLQLDEASLQSRIKAYTPRRGSKGRRIRTSPNPTAPPPSQPHRPQDPPVGGPARARQEGHGSGALIAARSLSSRLITRDLVDAFLASRKNRGLDAKTLANYRSALNPFALAFPTLPLERLTIESYGRSLELLPSARRSVYGRMRALYTWLYDQHHIPHVNLDRPDFPHSTAKPTYWSWEQISHILHSCLDPLMDCVVVGLAQTGCRREEFCSISAANFRGRWAKVDSKGTKANPYNERIIYFPKETQLRLTMALGANPYLMDGKYRLTPDRLDERMREVLVRAGLHKRGICCHPFRHSYKGEYLHNQGNPQLVEILMGHFSKSMSQHYLHVFDDELHAEADRAAPRRFLQGELSIQSTKEVTI